MQFVYVLIICLEKHYITDAVYNTTICIYIRQPDSIRFFSRLPMSSKAACGTNTSQVRDLEALVGFKYIFNAEFLFFYFYSLHLTS